MYLLLSIESLGIVIGFGYFMVYFIQVMDNVGGCLLLYDFTYLVVMVSVSAIWLISGLVNFVFVFRLKGNFN